MTSLPNLVADSCANADGSVPGSTAYTNLGTVTVPGDTDTDPSSYCNPPHAITIESLRMDRMLMILMAQMYRVVPGDPVVWTYDVTNVGSVAVAQADIRVTDNVPGVNPVFDSVKSGNTDNILDPGEVWTYRAGPSLDLTATILPNLVADSCNNAAGSEPGSTAYTNLGTVTVPGDTDTDPSSYCGPSPLGSLGDFVWEDANKNGIQDDGTDSGIPGVTVNLLAPGVDGVCGTGDELTLNTTTTDTDGSYQFTDLDSGQYCIEFVPPDGYDITTRNQGGNDAIDSDADQSTGQSVVINLPAGVADDSWDAGLVKTGPTNLDDDTPPNPEVLFLPMMGR